MAELALTRLSSDSAHSVLQDLLSNRPFKPTDFYSPYTLNTFLTHDGKSLYIATLGNERTFVTYKEENNDVRTLFDYPSTNIVEALLEHFHPKYLAANLLSVEPTGPNVFTELEYKIKLKPLAELSDKTIRKKYNYALKKNGSLVYKPYTAEYAEKIGIFLQKWNTTRTEIQNKYARTQNDLHFLEMYKNDPKLIGGVVLHKDDVVAYTLCVPSMDGNLIALFNKVLRGYTELGLYTYVERAKQLTSRGFSEVYIGTINNDFKKHFLAGATVEKNYCQVLHNELELKNEERYANFFF